MKRKEQIERAWLGRAVQSNHRYDEKHSKKPLNGLTRL